ncbi:hypothetical protein OHB26_35320 [Nocardia sp. NBC_01503]|nr:hypothetical protein [Nocardia sp. NBC_01503]WTL32107.1 hypothetical protein OHB26_35320 [Nocardia sp. NBC_01503]
MTEKSDSEQPEARAPRRDEDEKPAVRDDPEATTEDQAANMDYEGDTPN